MIPLKHGGETALDNLAFCCALCNRRKGSDLSAFDPATGELARLFHPRSDRWNQHFELRGGEMFPLTASARATVSLLRLNRPDRIELLVRSGWLWTRD